MKNSLFLRLEDRSGRVDLAVLRVKGFHGIFAGLFRFQAQLFQISCRTAVVVRLWRKYGNAGLKLLRDECHIMAGCGCVDLPIE
jgi:hypothetical protein